MCGGDSGGTGEHWVIGHELPFPPEMQVLVEGWANIDHAARQYCGALPDRLPPGDGPPFVPERIVTGHTTQL